MIMSVTELQKVSFISKITTLHVCYTFLYISLPLLLHGYNVKLPSYTVNGGNVVRAHKKNFMCSCSHFFFHFRSFSSCWSLAFLVFSPPL